MDVGLCINPIREQSGKHGQKKQKLQKKLMEGGLTRQLGQPGRLQCCQETDSWYGLSKCTSTTCLPKAFDMHRPIFQLCMNPGSMLNASAFRHR